METEALKLPGQDVRKLLAAANGDAALLYLYEQSGLPGATAGAAWYVTLPTMLALVAAGVLLWTTAQWSRGGMTLRAYVHARTVRRLPAEALIAAGMSAFGAVGQGIPLLLGNPANWAKIGHFTALASVSAMLPVWMTYPRCAICSAI